MKRFYKEATVGTAEEGHTILLDGRPVRTPGRALLAMPNTTLAQAVVAEWAAQLETIKPEAMPLTRLANTVVDQLPAKRPDALHEIAGYAAADLLCYRVAHPAVLAERQHATWEPWLDWAAAELGAPLLTTTDLDPLPQPQASLEALDRAAEVLDDWRLIGLHATTRLTGSMVLGLAMVEGKLEAEPAFTAAMLEELHEIEQWGLEAEQARRHTALQAELAAAELYCRALLKEKERGK
jgi:chaperone required for assembly of F1-ATPase